MTNRAFQLTPPGSAAISIVRLTGPAVRSFLDNHFSHKVAVGRCVHGDLTDRSRTIDDPVVVLSPDGNQADVNLHGGPWVVQSFFDLLRRSGFDVTEWAHLPLPYEVCNGPTAIENEMLACVPLATTEQALSELLRQPDAWREFDLLSPDKKRAMAKRMIEDRGLWWLLHPPRVAIIGPPNVGKSTLANQLFGQARSITADLPGTTRDWVGEMANLNGLAVVLMDTPGIRSTRDAIESVAIEQAGREIEKADIVVIVLDATRVIGIVERALLDQHPHALRIMNKSDLPSAGNGPADAWLAISAKTGDGCAFLVDRIKMHFQVDLNPQAARWWTLDQRARLIENCAEPS